LILITSPTIAQDLQRSGGAYTLPPGSMPAWTVPVLRLVSSTHVEPTTGIVISDSGLVLVPEDFASMGDEIIVLDGGTDIVRHGRPARIERKFTAQGLQVLFVEGLRRNGVTLSAGTPAEGNEIVLTAFPPAEQIAEGKPPLNLPASVVVFGETGNAAISGETRLPNVTGGLVDACGYLVAVSLAADVQTMEPSAETRYQWKESLMYILSEMQITPREFACPGLGEMPKPEPEPEPEPEAEEPAVEEDIVEEEVAPEDQLVAEQEPPPEDPLIDVVEEFQGDILPPLEQGSDGLESPVDLEESVRWPWLLAALILFGLGFILHRLRQGGSVKPTVESADETSQSIPILQDNEEESGLPVPALDSLLRIHGVLADGTPLEASCPVNERAINVTIGRADADLKIESNAVSRSHANLNGTSQALTVTDLGSSNGTLINGIPCLEGEILFIEPGDTLILGNARCTIEITPAESSNGGKP
jgi:hypothetical protein